MFWDNLERQVRDFDRNFTKRGRSPRDKDWRPVRFAVRDVVVAFVVARLEPRNNILQVDVFASYDADAIPGWSGTKYAMLYVLSQAYKCGSSMGISFTSNKGARSVPVPEAVVVMAEDYGILLNSKHVAEGSITPKQARHLFLAFSEFSPEAKTRIMELSVADLVAPERICYMVHHGTYTKEEMETILLGSEFPDHILLGKVTPEEFILYQDVIFRTRDTILGGSLDRALKLKEIVGEDGKVQDLEGDDRRIKIGFDPKFFAKIYDIEEETPFPAWYEGDEVVLSPGEKAVVMVRARDRADFMYYFEQDVEAIKSLKKTYKDEGVNFFLLVTRNVSELNQAEFKKYKSRLKKLSVTLLVYPDSVSILDKDSTLRLRESETMRHGVGSGEKRDDVKSSVDNFDFNSTDLSLVSIPKTLALGRISLPELLAQALYDENELFQKVNKHNVRSRYHLVCDRVQYLAHQYLLDNENKKSMSLQVLAFFSEIWKSSPEMTRKKRLLPIFWTPEQVPKYVKEIEKYIKRGYPFEKLLKFLNTAAKNNRVVVLIQNKHSKPVTNGKEPSLTEEGLEQSFTGQFVPDWINNHGNIKLEDVVHKQLWRAANSARRGQANSVNLSEIPNTAITIALHKLVYENPKKVENQKVAVNMLYTDGSQARPFPLFCLRERRQSEMSVLKKLPTFRVGMISTRHGKELDHIVDHYWFRNIEVSQPGMTSAESDELSYQITLRKLNELLKDGAPKNIEFYQTGLQTTVVGFFRAVTHFLSQKQNDPPMLMIRPIFHRKKREGNKIKDIYLPGEIWS